MKVWDNICLDCLRDPSNGGTYGQDRFQACEGAKWTIKVIVDVGLFWQLLRYVNSWDHLVLGIEIVFFCFIFYYIIEEILEIVHTGYVMFSKWFIPWFYYLNIRWEYFNSVWNIMDIIVIVVSLCTNGNYSL